MAGCDDGNAMTGLIRRGRYQARWVTGEGPDLQRAQALRHLCFVTLAGLPDRPDGRDSDLYDPLCLHLLVEDGAGQVVATCRLLLLSPVDVTRAYAAQFYDLTPLRAESGPLMEVGRFCLAPGQGDPDILRLAWAMIGGIVDAEGVRVMFGCSSFTGTDPAPYAQALALLGARHIGPAARRPVAHAPALALSGGVCGPDALRQMPPLLRTYLAMGAWVGAEVVADPALHTLHVFTAVDTGSIPEARARRLRMIFGGGA